MKLTVFNGSPRGKDSNTRILINHFLYGFLTTDGNSYEVAYLVHLKEHGRDIELFQQADHVLISLPLYFDSMPSIVKTFIETLEPFCQRSANPAIGFMVHSGYPEPNQSRYLERYFQKLAARLGCEYKGTIIRGAVEAIRIHPLLDKTVHKFIHAIGRTTNIGHVGYFLNSKRLNEKLYKLGITFGKTGEFDRDIVYQLTQPEKLTKFGFWLFKLVAENLYFNNMLKKNKAYDRRFYRPYAH